MNDASLLNASCRVALAALLHDLGKFAERTGKSFPGIDASKASCCPRRRGGGFSHIHAAYTRDAIQAIAPHLPDLQSGDMTPFSAWNEENPPKDSLLNGAARHHTPQTPLQWIIAIADRLASGFERASFEEYNQALEEGEENGRKVNHLSARMWPLLGNVRLQGDFAQSPRRLPLRALAAETLFPGAEPPAKPQEEYRVLWEQFTAALEKIPSSHRASLPLWLDHFDALFLGFTHAIPSATAGFFPGRGFRAIPADVSLYDHSKAAATLAVALWRFHQESGDFSQTDVQKWDSAAHPEFLLIQGNFFGIQEFIFGSGESALKASKRLRGRSFTVALITELAAIKTLEAFQLPVTSQIINAAGKFLIVAPNLPDAKQRLQTLRRELDAWFLNNGYGQWGVGLVETPARRQDFHKKTFPKLLERLKRDMEIHKRQRFALCGAGDDAPRPPIFQADYPQGACAVCNKSPATRTLPDDGATVRLCGFCHDQIQLGETLVKRQRLIISRNRVDNATLEMDYFGYRVTLTDAAASPPPAADLLRLWDFSLAHPDGQTPLWNGCARRAINGHVPKDDQGRLQTFETIAETAIQVVTREDGSEERRGVAALNILKGDVDDLGQLFRRMDTFSRMAGMSRQLNTFFALWLPWKCARDFPDAYTVFAGGDDFFLIGPWLQQIRLAETIHTEFARYVANNPDLHFSAGLTMTKPTLPIPALAVMADEALDDAKEYAGKNAVTCWNRTLSWQEFQTMLAAERELNGVVELFDRQYRLKMSTGYLHTLLHLCDKAESAAQRPQDAIWRSWFAYRSWRFVVDKLRDIKPEERQAVYQDQLAQKIGAKIEQFRGNYKIALFTHLYQRRKAVSE
ncbi:MAG: type III-A CRISPR-associated protein Cas10/Csm1 [Magnetococcales bacterium]|nr:type III-A CRISPR-associated protein Cas10/Csm1 [Magnetococcales bacterium]